MRIVQFELIHPLFLFVLIISLGESQKSAKNQKKNFLAKSKDFFFESESEQFSMKIIST